jgi:DNA-binding NtrC family response regulator
MNIFATRFRKKINGMSKKALKIIMDYPFPGNVRELRNIIEYAVNMCPKGQIQSAHLPAYLSETRYYYGRSMPEEAEVSGWSASNVKSSIEQNGQKTWASLERDMIIKALVKTKGRRNKAADMLGWGRSTLWRKIKQYKIDA